MNFQQALHADGMRPREIIADGRRRRCQTDDKPKRRNGQYVLLPDGRTGFWRNFAVSSEWSVWKEDSVTRRYAPVDPAILEAHRAKEREKRRTAILKVRELWAQSRPYRVHPYLADKGLSAEGCAGLRLWSGKVWTDDGPVDDLWLLIPMWWEGRLVNIQRISTTGIKRQMTAAPQIACCHSILRPRSSLTVIAEGFATGLAAYQSSRHASVHVAFYADNLLPLVDRMRPTGAVVFAADNDHGTFRKRGVNPGVEKATNAAELIGAGVCYPQGIEGTDYADALREWGPTGGRRIERELMAGAKYVYGAAA